jgi:cytoskeletal protein CcmA (bactofilin family)
VPNNRPLLSLHAVKSLQNANGDNNMFRKYLRQKKNDQNPGNTKRNEITGLSSSLPSNGDDRKASKPSDHSVISNGVQVLGDLKSTKSMQIDCHLVGNIQAHIMTIGINGNIEGNVTADDVVVKGTINGDLLATKVRLNSTAKVFGNITHGVIAIEDGARFEGQVKQSDNLQDNK